MGNIPAATPEPKIAGIMICSTNSEPPIAEQIRRLTLLAIIQGYTIGPEFDVRRKRIIDLIDEIRAVDGLKRIYITDVEHLAMVLSESITLAVILAELGIELRDIRGREISDHTLIKRFQNEVVQALKSAQENPRIVTLSSLPNYRLPVHFQDGTSGEYDLAPSIERGGVFEKLRPAAEFEKVRVAGDGRYVYWDSELVIDAASIYRDVKGQKPSA